MSFCPKMNIKAGWFVFVCTFFVVGFFTPCQALASGKLYFLSIVEKNDAKKTQIILEWGSAEGNIPEEIESFRLYRSVNSGSGFGEFEALPLPEPAFFPNGMPNGNPASILRDRILENTIARRFENLLQTLTHWGEDANIGNFHKILSPVLDPGDPQDPENEYQSLKKMLMIRKYPEIAVACSLGYVDKDVDPANQYKYLLSAITYKKDQILPVGKTGEINPGKETILPEPLNFKQILVSTNSENCSQYDKNLDDNIIHMTWNIPSSPNELGLQIMTYGYDIFWADESDSKTIGRLEARDYAKIQTHMDAGRLHRFNLFPIVISGPASSEGRLSYLVKDNGENHDIWERGDKIVYYLAAIDLAGHYSAGDLVKVKGIKSDLWATVPDMAAPPAPWGISSREEKADFQYPPLRPKLFLEWETITKTSWIRNYGSSKNICSGNDSQIFYSASGEDCIGNGRDICVDLDIQSYKVFRFDSPEEASRWGDDTDGDKWPDNVEKNEGTNPCDPLSFPTGNSLPVIETIAHNSSKKIMEFEILDALTLKYDKVYWYRVATEDFSGNTSSLSPPVRVVMPDRRQPENRSASAIITRECEFSAEYEPSCGSAGDDTRLKIIINNSAAGQARHFELYHYQESNTGEKRKYKFIGKKIISGNEIELTTTFFKGCGPIECPKGDVCGYVIRFFNFSNKLICESDSFDIPDFCQGFYGCVILFEENCKDVALEPEDNYSGGPIYFCPDLDEFETARLYIRVNGKMSPFLTVENSSGCKVIQGLKRIVPDKVCLGFRKFSKNHVGSEMKYYGCLSMPAYPNQTADEWIDPDPFPAPIIDEIQAVEEGDNMYFRISWTCQSEGLAAFPIQMKNSDTQKYETSFNLEKDSQGRFFHNFKLDGTDDLNKKWFFSVRAVDLTMRASKWSKKKSASWDDLLILENQPKKVLPWPDIDLPGNSDKIQPAFIIKDNTQTSPLAMIPAVVLSDDFRTLDLNKNCESVIRALELTQECNGGECIKDEEVGFHLCPLCPILQSQMKMDSFIVYRQEEGKDFVQVSPLLEKVHCYSDDGKSYMQDPYIFLKFITSNAITGISSGVTSEQIQGLRLIFVDRYPRRAFAKIRYKILAVDKVSGEVEQIFTSNWIQ